MGEIETRIRCQSRHISFLASPVGSRAARCRGLKILAIRNFNSDFQQQCRSYYGLLYHSLQVMFIVQYLRQYNPISATDSTIPPLALWLVACIVTTLFTAFQQGCNEPNELLL